MIQLQFTLLTERHHLTHDVTMEMNTEVTSAHPGTTLSKSIAKVVYD